VVAPVGLSAELFRHTARAVAVGRGSGWTDAGRGHPRFIIPTH